MSKVSNSDQVELRRHPAQMFGGQGMRFGYTILAGYRRNDPAEPPAGVEIGFVTDDVPAAWDAALAAGAIVVSPPTTKPWGQTVAYVRDLDGMLIEICTPVTS
jgi:catechol 2,3-dioxygenase-like lactoylglutathione lyase family enzyme